MFQDYFYLGTVTKHFGYKGQVTIYLDTDEPEKYTNLESVFIHIHGELIPFFIDKMQYRGGNQATVSFKDVDFEESKELIKADLYLPIDLLPPLTGNKFYFHEVKGFSVVDKVKGNIGICEDFIDISRQPIMQIQYEGKEILIPAIDQIFEEIDRENKIIRINAPEGLIDLYLE